MSAPGWAVVQPAILRGRYAPIPAGVSGLYVIGARTTGQVLYVGLSRTGRLRKTCLRHFQVWQQDRLHQHPRQTYSAEDCSLTWLVITGGRSAVEAAELTAIARLRPRDNYRATGAQIEEVADVCPF